MSYENPWFYNGKEFDSDDIGNNYGFVYRITNTINGHDYIGRKFFHTIIKPRILIRHLYLFLPLLIL